VVFDNLDLNFDGNGAAVLGMVGSGGVFPGGDLVAVWPSLTFRAWYALLRSAGDGWLSSSPILNG
jgi:hypothetical protein